MRGSVARLDKRQGALAASVAIHLGVVAWLLFAPDTAEVARPVDVLKAFDVGTGEAAQPAQPPPVPQAPIIDVVPAPVVSPVPGATGSATAGTAGGCAIAARLQAALIADSPAMAEVAAIPADDLSVANAILLWDGQVAALDAARPNIARVAEQLAEQVAPSCLDEEQTGPVFMFLSEAGRTVSIAIGSGRWQWRNFFIAAGLTEVHPPADPPRISP